jgi:integrase/recombinase XerD
MGSNPTPRIEIYRMEPYSVEDYTRWAVRRYRWSTIERDIKILKQFKNAGVLDFPERVVKFVEEKNCRYGTKHVMICCYLRWLKYIGAKPTQLILEYLKDLERMKEKRLARIPSYQVACAVILATRGQTRNLLWLILHTGLRVNEALNLRWHQVNFDKKYIVIEESEKRSEGAYIPLDDNSLMALTQQRKYLKSNDDRVFTIDERTVRKVLCHARRKMQYLDGAELVCPKNLRHIFATRTYIRTKDLVYTQRLLRHKSILSTQRYLHYTLHRKPSYEVKIVNKNDYPSIKLLLEEGFEKVHEDRDVVFLRRLKD